MATKIYLLVSLILLVLLVKIEAVPTPNTNAETNPLAAGNNRLTRQYDWRLERILQAMQNRNAMQVGLNAAEQQARFLGNRRLARQYDWRLERMKLLLQEMQDKNAMQPGLDAAALQDRILAG